MPPDRSQLGFLIHDVARLMRKRFEQRARTLGLTRAQWQVLVHLGKHEGIHQSGLAEILEVEPITLMRLLDKLESRGFVERRRHVTDRRIWLLYLQQAAHPVLEELRDLGALTRGESFAGVSEAEQNLLSEVLTAVKSNLLKACLMPVAEQEAQVG